MAALRRLPWLVATVLLMLLMFTVGWVVATTGIGATVDETSLTELERRFAQQMRGVALVGEFTIAGRRCQSQCRCGRHVAARGSRGPHVWSNRETSERQVLEQFSVFHRLFSVLATTHLQERITDYGELKTRVRAFSRTRSTHHGRPASAPDQTGGPARDPAWPDRTILRDSAPPRRAGADRDTTPL